MSQNGSWRRATMMMVVVLVVVMGSVVGSPQRVRNNSKDPVFNIWEFAISNSDYNPRRQAAPVKDPCTWAIVRCCLVNDRAERDDCFDRNGCAGAWFNDLCSKRFKGLARSEVQASFFGSGF